MEQRTPGHARRAAAIALLAIGLCGCDDVYTVQSIAHPDLDPSSVPDVTGLWLAGESGNDYSVLQFAEDRYDTEPCRPVEIRALGMTSGDDDRAVGDEICFVPIAGHLVVQIRTVGEPQLYQHFLAKVDRQSMALCASIWDELLDWARAHPGQESAAGLEYTVRHRDFGMEMIVTSSRDALRAYIEANARKMARRCDEGHEDGPGWMTLRRITPPRSNEDIEAQ